MFFFFSKLLYYFITPISWLFFCALGYLLSTSPKWKHRFGMSFVTIFLLFTMPWFINNLLGAWEHPPQPIASVDTYEVGVVLTGVAQVNAPHDRVFFNKGADRLTQALLLYKAGKIKKILITGGDVDLMGKLKSHEARQLGELLLAAGVPQADIWIEERSFNTRENAVNTHQVLLEKGLHKDELLLITSAFHLPRALACFRKVGLRPVPFSTDMVMNDYEKRLQLITLLPSDKALHRWNILLKEWVGMLTYRLMGWV